MNSSQKVLIIGFVWPEPNSSAAGTRMLQLISLFKELNWEIIFASPAQDSEYMEDLEKAGITKASIQLNSDSFNHNLKNLNPDIVLFDRFMMEEQFGWRVENVCPDAIRILDCEDLHCLRHAREKALKQHRTFELQDLLEEETAKREVASIIRCDLTLVISEFEMEVLKEVFKCDGSLLHYIPLFSSNKNLDELPLYENRKDFVFIGNFHHNPNADAVLFLKEEIWPRIHKQLPLTTMQIYGAYPSQKINRLHNPSENFYVNGRAENAGAVIRNARIMIAPLRFGAGIKGKLLEAMQNGTPNVTTPIGIEGMPGDLKWSGIVANTSDEIATGAVRLYNDFALWRTSEQNGFEIINQRFLREKFASDLINRILDLKAGLSQHRAKNFTGAMLRHHTMKSTEYMSRWISEKNKS